MAYSLYGIYFLIGVYSFFLHTVRIAIFYFHKRLK